MKVSPRPWGGIYYRKFPLLPARLENAFLVQREGRTCAWVKLQNSPYLELKLLMQKARLSGRLYEIDRRQTCREFGLLRSEPDCGALECG